MAPSGPYRGPHDNGFPAQYNTYGLASSSGLANAQYYGKENIINDHIDPSPSPYTDSHHRLQGNGVAYTSNDGRPQFLSGSQQYTKPVQAPSQRHVSQGRQYQQPQERSRPSLPSVNLPPPHQQPYQLKEQRQQPQQAYAVVVPPSPRSSHKMHDGIYEPAPPRRATETHQIDYQVLLLSMAEEYLAAAYKCGSAANSILDDAQMQEYHKLIAIGLRCLEALLKHFKLAPEREANIRLRYATVLYEETDNVMEAEEALSKGISMSDRHRFVDLKYNMEHLLARILFRKNHRAAFKFLDRVITDAEAYQHVAWIYAFRFLKVSLHLELSSHQDFISALAQLRLIINAATTQGDKAILATAAVMEALIGLKDTGGSEGFEQAQRALAGVRSLQLDPAISRTPQLTILTSFVDVCCHLQRFDPYQALKSMQGMQDALSSLTNDPSQGGDGSFAVPLKELDVPLATFEGGVIRQSKDGPPILMMDWLPFEDIHNVGLLLGGLAIAHKNTSDGCKSEQIFLQSIQRQEGAQKASAKHPRSHISASKQALWREHLTYYSRIQLAFTLAARTSWVSAREQVAKLKQVSASWSDIPKDLFLLSNYLEGTIAQGTGDVENAFTAYQIVIGASDGRVNSESNSNTHLHSHSHQHVSPLQRELSILATLNTILLTRPASSPHHNVHLSMMADLATSFQNRSADRIGADLSSNRLLLCAYHILTAISPLSSTIILTKQSLQNALQHAKATANHQLIGMVLNIMTWKFFSGVVGEQAEKSARASQSLAKKGGDALWTSVSSGALAKCLERVGRDEEALAARAEGEKLARDLPPRILELVVKTEAPTAMVQAVGERGSSTATASTGVSQSYETAMQF